ncbi:C6 transcription factor, putative [Talaromyces stipitatus ATCC 10500]|uniref:C6 transcription factor, putative n=1 Tax=Talaromyces stipitatus (strain ATCC 10500 / CBS 375.48 / QM 6759 / NRRL 1006) TaxID=441959 RepID=B8MBK8_TALSN|nr:C6 transcription factor, putative [Talaromyces stipitatus ATCC 10500]EED17872.1 C6 transcription factor, putative [Talaromyces stipitatus ATCC 10500]
MTRSRACDPCATRKIKCDRGNPCGRCHTLGISCTTSRAQSKPGPKGPWAEKRRLARLQESILQDSATVPESQLVPVIPEQQQHGDGGSSSSSTVESPPTSSQFSPTLPIPLIQQYLDVYHERLYSVWPVVDRDEMSLRIQDPEDAEAYALCTALTAVVLAHLKFNPSDIAQAAHAVDNTWVAGESERARATLRYHEKPSLELLLSSFFLHIFYANRGHVCRATVLIREAITLAQFLELDQAKHYIGLSKKEAQLHLRIIRILSITERGHTTRFDLPRILVLDPDLPQLETQDVQPGLVAFTDLCQLFHTFGRAMDSDMLIRTADFFVGTDKQLRGLQQVESKMQVQQADFLITQQWMRIMVWKMSIFHIKLSVNADDENLSICFPEHVAEIVLMYLSHLSRNIIEAHGIGMQMKLADVAISLADMLSCIPWVSERRQIMKVGPEEMVCHIAEFLASLRGNVNPRMEILFEKLQFRGWGNSPRPMPGFSLETLPTTIPTTTPTPITTVLPIRQIEDICNEAEEEEDDDEYDDYVKRTILHTADHY